MIKWIPNNNNNTTENTKKKSGQWYSSIWRLTEQKLPKNMDNKQNNNNKNVSKKMQTKAHPAGHKQQYEEKAGKMRECWTTFDYNTMRKDIT